MNDDVFDHPDALASQLTFAGRERLREKMAAPPCPGRVEHRRVAGGTFPASPHRTGRAVFPHPALRSPSS